jgi:endonuclease III
MSIRTDWSLAIRPLLKKYKNRKHPLEHHNLYQLVVMVILSAQSTDDLVNSRAPELFKAYPNMKSLANAKPEDLFSYLHGIRNFANKAKWITAIAQQIKTDSLIPLSMDKLTELPGIGRKSASVILRGAGAPAEGIIVDIHVIRVAPRLGLTKETDPKKIEVDLMKILPSAEWDAGMAMSFLGREICRPKPLCEKCLMKNVCLYYSKLPKYPG